MIYSKSSSFVPFSRVTVLCIVHSLLFNYIYALYNLPLFFFFSLTFFISIMLDKALSYFWDHAIILIVPHK